MRAEAVRTGKEIIEAEKALDSAFASHAIDEASLQEALTRIGVLRARLRYVHLDAHVRQRALLTEAQIATYDTLRAQSRGQGGHQMHGQVQGTGA